MPAGTGNANFQQWAVLNGDNSLQSRNINGNTPGQHLARVDQTGASDPSGVYYILNDRLNSVRDVVDASGTVQDAINYDAYGNILSGETDSNYCGWYAYTGQEFDVQTDLEYNNARWYDATMGRWISQDPMGFDAGDSNLYRYVNNAPTNGTDPSGLWGRWGPGNGPIRQFLSGQRCYPCPTPSNVPGTGTFPLSYDEPKAEFTPEQKEWLKKAEASFPKLQNGILRMYAPQKGSNCFAYCVGKAKAFEDEALYKYNLIYKLFGDELSNLRLALTFDVNQNGPTAFQDRIISPLTKYYKQEGFTPVAMYPNLQPGATYDKPNPGKQRIAVYGHLEKVPNFAKKGENFTVFIDVTHAALQMKNGTWRSQLGTNAIIIDHKSIVDLEGPLYGSLIAIYEK